MRGMLFLTMPTEAEGNAIRSVLVVLPQDSAEED